MSGPRRVCFCGSAHIAKIEAWIRVHCPTRSCSRSNSAIFSIQNEANHFSLSIWSGWSTLHALFQCMEYVESLGHRGPRCAAGRARMRDKSLPYFARFASSPPQTPTILNLRTAKILCFKSFLPPDMVLLWGMYVP